MYAENRYANIENELLVVVFGAERFQTLYEKQFRVKGPQKPLEIIQLKNLTTIPQRMLLRTYIQNYDMKIIYRTGTGKE